jgi:ketosteroid isomerase-like protein
MASANVELVRRWNDAFNRRDMDVLLELTSPEFEFVPYLGALIETITYRGHDGLRKYFEDADAAWQAIEARLVEVRELDGTVIALGELRARGRASGLEVRVSLAWVGEFDGGQITRLRSYETEAKALEAAGLFE